MERKDCCNMSSRQNNRSRHMDRKCKSCGSHDSACKCQFKAPRKKAKPLASDCVVANSVVCSKKVQKVAELAIPFARFGFEPSTVADLAGVQISIVPDLANIVINRRVIKDKVINMGFVPTTITVTPPGGTAVEVGPFNIPFQLHTDCPGACPEDTVIETPFVLEGTFAQPGISVVVGAGATAIRFCS